jgi:hypothetical protein
MFAHQADLSTDGDFRQRIAACAATQPIGDLHPTAWADAQQWAIAAAPGFADAYAYACETGVERPGRDAAVITDEQLLAAVQHRLAELGKGAGG